MQSVSNRFIYTTLSIVSALAMAFLVWLIYFKSAATTELKFVVYLPYANATFNALSAICLFMGVRAIKNKNLEKHKKLLLAAFVFSTLFLVSYIIYHNFHGDTKFMAQGFIRPIYFFTLISHIVLSIPALPMVLITFALGLLDKKTTHKKWAKWTFPIWMYVSVTGVLIVILLKTFNV